MDTVPQLMLGIPGNVLLLPDKKMAYVPLYR